MVIYPIILVIVKYFVIFQILKMYIILCQPFCFMSFSFFFRLVSIRSVCILQVIIGGVLFGQGIILISIQCSFNTLKITTSALIKIINRCLSVVGTLQSFLLGFLYLKLNFYIGTGTDELM